MSVFAVLLALAVQAEQYDFSYDVNGNLMKGKDNYYEYNDFNQLFRVRLGNSSGTILEEYAYDHEGNRVLKEEYDSSGQVWQTTYYVDKNFVRVENSSGTFDTVYYYHDDALVGRLDPDGKRYFYHPDHLGSTNLITDESGNVVERTDYLPFGETINGGNDRYQYTGKENDETGLLYYGARYYDAAMMKFTQPDSLIPDVYNPQALNRYAYVLNNPLKYVDPNGQAATDSHLIGSYLAMRDLGFSRWDSLRIGIQSTYPDLRPGKYKPQGSFHLTTDEDAPVSPEEAEKILKESAKKFVESLDEDKADGTNLHVFGDPPKGLRIEISRRPKQAIRENLNSHFGNDWPCGAPLNNPKKPTPDGMYNLGYKGS